MKKIYIMMMLVFSGMMAMAQTSVWDGSRALWTQGAGTENNPYRIESAQQLAFLAYMVNKGYGTENMYFKLTTDIDLHGSEDQPWFPIGMGGYFNEDGCDRGSVSGNSTAFQGHFDGDGHSIFNIYVDHQYAGLFGVAKAANDNPVVIENVFVVNGTIRGNTCGGVLGLGDFSTDVYHCWNGATVEGADYAGGIIGNQANQVLQCYNVGSINCNVAGGIAGGSVRVVEECFNTGAVDGHEMIAGGIIGRANGALAMNNCYNTGTVTAVGGDSGTYPIAGGLIGMAMMGTKTINNSYNVGEVNGTNNVGCIVGVKAAGNVVVENSYYLNDCNQSQFGTALSADYMRSQEYVDLLNGGNRDLIWALDSNNLNNGFPVLAEDVLAVNVLANPADGGIVEGGGAYCFGSSVTLTATANEGYTFVNWTKDGEEVSSDPTYSFNVAASCSYVANFILNNYEVTVEANPAEAGEVTGAGTYQYGTSATVTVIPNPEYQLNYWSKDGETVSEELSYTFIVTDDCQLVAHLIPSDVNEWGAAVLKVYPNPSQGTFTVEGTGCMTVTNLLGQTILTRDVDGQTIVELPQGTYFVKLDGITQKVVVK